MIDIFFLLTILIFAFFGYRHGAVKAVGSLIGSVLGIYLAGKYYEPGAVWLGSFTGWEGNMPRVVLFVCAFILINRAVGLLFWLFNKATHIITKIPIIKQFNTLLGIVFGIIEAFVVIGVSLYVVERLPLSEGLMQSIANSGFAQKAHDATEILAPLLPEALQTITSTIDWAEHVFVQSVT